MTLLCYQISGMPLQCNEITHGQNFNLTMYLYLKVYLMINISYISHLCKIYVYNKKIKHIFNCEIRLSKKIVS